MSVAEQVRAPAPASPYWSGRIFEADHDLFRSDYNVRSFAMRNKLAHHDLFKPERLALAAERAIAKGRSDRFVATGGGQMGATFADMGSKPKVAQAIASLGSAGAWMKLSTINGYDDDYADLLSDAMKDIEELTDGRIKGLVSYAQFTVFMASPNIVTPYHIDHESNFLSQITGERKVVCVYPPDDRELLPQREIESYYVDNINAAKYREDMLPRGTQYELKPGMTIHHPPLAPHWVRNGDDLSISLSLNFCMKPLEYRSRVHQANFFLRKLGMNPPEPRTVFPDTMKSGALAMISKPNPKTYRETVFSAVDRIHRVESLLAKPFTAKKD